MRTLVLTALIAFGSPSFADIPRPNTVADTLRVIHKAVKAAGFPDAEIDFSDQSVSTDPNKDDSFTLFPDNLHLGLQGAASDSERQALLDGFVAILSETNLDTEDFTLDQIMPRLQHIDYVDQNDELVAAAFVGDLAITYIIDYPTHTTSLHPDAMADKTLTRKSVADIALKNLLSAAKDMTIAGSDAGIYYLVFDGFYENAMMLDSPMWDNIVDQIGPIAVTVPSRDFVMIAPRENAEVVAQMQAVRDETLAESPYPLSTLTFGWENSGWVVIPE